MLSLDPRTKFYIVIASNLILLFHLNELSRQLFLVVLIMLFFTIGKISVGIKILLFYIISFTFSQIQTDNELLSIIGYMFYSINLMLPCIYSGVLLCSTTTPAKTVASLRKMKTSEKVIIPISVLMRFFPTLWQEIIHIHNAMKIRGFLNFGTIIKNPSITFERYIIPILMSTSSTANDLAVSAICKGVENNGQHTCLEKVKLTVFDFFICILFTAIIVFGFF